MQEKFYLFTEDDEGRGSAAVYATREEAEKEVAELDGLVGRGFYAGEQKAWVLLQGAILVAHGFMELETEE